MADERNYYVICADGCKFPAMTKEQILTAIEQAISTGEIKDVNSGFITTIKEQNANYGLKFWVGTSAQYNAIPEKQDDTLYLLTDETTEEDINKIFAETSKAAQSAEEKATTALEKVSTYNATKELFNGSFKPNNTVRELQCPEIEKYNFIAVTVSDDGESESAPIFLYKIDGEFADTAAVGVSGDYVNIRFKPQESGKIYFAKFLYNHGDGSDKVNAYFHRIIGIC